jgi:hypothetical protein
MRTTLILALLACANGLPPLVTCQAGGRGGRPGLCASDTGAVVVLRGSNYIRLGNGTGHATGGYHTTFDVGVYNRSRYAAAFGSMERNGYNVNRVFLDERPGSGIGGARNATAPLDSAWVDRLAEYISDADLHGIYTLVTMVYTPDNAYFRNFSSQLPPLPHEWAAAGWNRRFLTPRGHDAFVEYAGQLAAALRARLAPAARGATLVSLQNELFLNGDEYPFGVRSGSVTLADGETYDMGDAAQRQQAADANTNRWAQRARARIREELPGTPVTVGVFTFFAVHKDGANGLLHHGCDAAHVPPPKGVDCRFPARPYWLSRAGLDFLDVHIYQPDGSPEALAANLQTEEWANVSSSVPVLMGEFGCNAAWGLTATTCAPHMRQLQASSCAQGFSGWLFWTYDCAEQGDWFTMMEAGGAIDKVLAPVVNPEPCKASHSRNPEQAASSPADADAGGFLRISPHDRRSGAINEPGP